MPFDLHHLAISTTLYQPQLRGLEVENRTKRPQECVPAHPPPSWSRNILTGEMGRMQRRCYFLANTLENALFVRDIKGLGGTVFLNLSTRLKNIY